MLSLLVILASVYPGQRPTVPIVIQASQVDDACSNGVVVGLNPRGDGFLSVRSAPGIKSRELSRLCNGELVYMCFTWGEWVGIVYARPNRDCNVMSPWVKTLPYTGPCRSGWIHKRYVELYAG